MNVKKVLLLIFAFALSLAGTAGAAVFTAFAAEEEFEVISTACGAFTAQNVRETAELSALSDGNFRTAYRVRVLEGETELLSFDLPYAAFGGAIVACDFEGNGCDQLYFSAQTGGSGGYSRVAVYDLSSGAPVVIFDDETFAVRSDFRAEYADNFRLRVCGRGETFYVALEGLRGADYLSELYGADGKLLNPVDATVSGLAQALPAFQESFGRDILVCYQEVWGLYHADSFGYLITELAWEDGGFRTFFRLMGSRGVPSKQPRIG